MSFILICFLLPFFIYADPEILSLQSLQEAEELALKYNQNLQSLDHLIEEMHQKKLVKISDYLPKLETIAQAFQAQHIQDSSGNKSSFLTQLVLTQTLISAKKYYDIKIASLMLKQFKLLKEAAINDLLYQVRRGYFKILLDKNRLFTAKEKLELFKILTLRVKERLNIGTATSFELNQSQVALSNTLSYYYDSEKKLHLDLNALLEIMGFIPGEVILDLKEKSISFKHLPVLFNKLEKGKSVFLETPLKNGLIYPDTNPKKQIDWISKLFNPSEIKLWEEIALEHRPDLKKRRNDFFLATKSVEKAYGAYLPRLELEFNYGGKPNPYNEYPTSSFLHQSFQWGAGLVLTWNLFDSFKKERNIRSAKAKRLSIRSLWNQNIQTAYRQINDQIALIINAMASHLSSSGNMKLAKQALLQAEEQLEIGYLSIFDYQISIDNFIEAKNLFFKSNFNLIDAYYGLRHASGIDTQGERNK